MVGRCQDERNVGIRDFGGKGGLSNLNDPKDPKHVTVVKAIVLPGEDHDLTSAALPKSRIPPAPAPQGQQASGGGEDMSVNKPQRGRERVEDAAPQAAQVLIVASVIFQHRNPRLTHACRPHAALGRHLKDEHVKDAAQNLAEGGAEDVPQDVAQDLAFGARAARALLTTPPPPPPLSLRSSR